MKRLMISLAVAISLTVGIAGSAAATSPDNHACGKANSHAITQALSTLGCEAHAP